VKKTLQRAEQDAEYICNHYKEHTVKFLKSDWRPTCREDLVALVQEAQIGFISCSKVVDILEGLNYEYLR
jgi:hypothetical protein